LGKEERIVGGGNVNIRSYPFLASLRYLSNNIIFCGGSIISNKHILTAAHCLYYESRDFNRIRIYTGITATRSTEGQVHKIAHVFFHPWFTAQLSYNGIYLNDIAIVMV
jgi:secreted trypsin-like serine protease